MKSLETRLRAAKPEAPPLPPDFAGRVMDEVVRQGLRVEPKKSFHPALWLRVSAGVLALALGAFTVNGAVFEVRENGSLELLFFGAGFVGDFLARLPFDLLLGALAAAGLGAWLLRAGRWGRVAVAWVALVAYGVTGLGGLALAETGLNETVQALTQQDEEDWPVVGWFYAHRARYRLHHPNLRMGKVVAVQGRSVTLETPTGEAVQAQLPPGIEPALGDFLRLRGTPGEAQFTAREGQICNPRRAGRYFRHMGPGMPGEMGPGMGRGMGPGMMRRGMGGGFGPGMAPGMGMGPGMQRSPGPRNDSPPSPQ